MILSILRMSGAGIPQLQAIDLRRSGGSTPPSRIPVTAPPAFYRRGGSLPRHLHIAPHAPWEAEQERTRRKRQADFVGPCVPMGCLRPDAHRVRRANVRLDDVRSEVRRACPCDPMRPFAGEPFRNYTLCARRHGENRAGKGCEAPSRGAACWFCICGCRRSRASSGVGETESAAAASTHEAGGTRNRAC